MKRFIRLGALAVGLLALFGTMTPAHSITAGAVAFTGTAQLSGPLGYPCADGAFPPDTDLDKCPTGVANTKSLPLPFPWPDNGNLPYVTGGNTRGFAFSSIVCAGASVNVMKDKAPVVAGLCSIGTDGSPRNSVTGWCGLSTGLSTGQIDDGTGNPIFFDIHFYGIASELIITGHWRKNNGQTGKVIGIVNAIPVPVVGVPPGNSCAGKTATTFTVTGVTVALPV